MIDQLVIDNKASYDDYEASLKTRTINNPSKKSIKETVPFSNVTYDFSAINGEVYWEERELEYVFEIIANTPAELEEAKMRFRSWVMNVMEAELHDPFIEKYHFKATFKDMSVDDDDSIEKTTITVKFSAYPYMIANERKEYVAEVTTTEKTLIIENNSSHRITPTFNSEVAFTLKMGNSSYGIGVGETVDDYFKFAVGMNEITIKAEESGMLTISFFEEVF